MVKLKNPEINSILFEMEEEIRIGEERELNDFAEAKQYYEEELENQRYQEWRQKRKMKNVAPEKTVYQFGGGKNSFQLSVSCYQTEYLKLIPEGQTRVRKGGHLETAENKTDCIELKLSANGVDFYSVKQKRMEDAHEGWDCFEGVYSTWLDAEKEVDMERGIAEKLYKDNSVEAITAKACLQHIAGNPIIDKIKQIMEDIPQKDEAKVAETGVATDKIDTRLGKIRNKLAKGVDAVTKMTGMQKIAQKTLHKNIAIEPISAKAGVKKFEKNVDKVIDKIVSNKKVKD